MVVHTMRGLEGIKVIEFAGYVAGPVSPRILGEMGATVIKVEPLTGDEQRTQSTGWGMPYKTEFDDPCYDASSTNKDWISVNLKTEEGREFAYRIIAECDVMLNNYRDKALQKLGLDYETIHARFPHVVWAQMRGYGEYGPEKDSRGYDATAYASRGGVLMSMPQKGEQFEPANFPVAFGDWNAGMTITAGILAALVRRIKTGEGDKVVSNLYHCACYAMTGALVARQQGAEYPKSRKEAPCPTNNTYKTRDGVWFLMCQGHYNKFFRDIFGALGLESLFGDPRYEILENVAARGGIPEVIGLMAEAIAQKNFDHWESVFREKDVPFQRLFTVDDILEDDEAFANDILRPTHYDDLGDYLLPTTPIRLGSLGDPAIYRAKPIGTDTRRIMSEHGYSSEIIESYVERGIVKCYDGELPPSVCNPSRGPRPV